MNFNVTVSAETPAQATELLQQELRLRGDALRTELLELLLRYIEGHHCQGSVHVNINVAVD